MNKDLAAGPADCGLYYNVPPRSSNNFSKTTDKKNVDLATPPELLVYLHTIAPYCARRETIHEISQRRRSHEPLRWHMTKSLQENEHPLTRSGFSNVSTADHLKHVIVLRDGVCMCSNSPLECSISVSSHVYTKLRERDSATDVARIEVRLS